MENRNGLVAATEMTQATGAAEREVAIAMVEEAAGSYRITLGADKFKSNYIQGGTPIRASRSTRNVRRVSASQCPTNCRRWASVGRVSVADDMSGLGRPRSVR